MHMNWLRNYTALTLTVALLGSSSCALVGSTTDWNPTNPVLEVVPHDHECTVNISGDEERKVEATCSTLLQADLVELVIEYRRACVAAGGTEETCIVTVRERP